jgi:hypothetical protein
MSHRVVNFDQPNKNDRWNEYEIEFAWHMESRGHPVDVHTAANNQQTFSSNKKRRLKQTYSSALYSVLCVM